MASRGACPRPGASRAGTSRAGMSRNQMLRAAQTSAIVHKEPAGAAGGACPARSRTSLAKVGPPPPPPRRVDMHRPALTKGMEMRRKAAEEKMKKLEAEKRKAEMSSIRPRRSRGPVGGDARFGRQKSTLSPKKTPCEQIKVLEEAITRGHSMTERSTARADAALDSAIARGHIVSGRTGARSRRTLAGPSGIGRGIRPLATATMIPEETKELAKMMNAEIVEAVPISDGPVDKIIIDPGAIRSDRSTIVAISPEPAVIPDISLPSDSANRSIQVISETLDEQDAIESAAVQSKLEDLQNARRDFVIAVANVSNNAVGLQDDHDDSILNIDDLGDQLEYMPSPPRPTPPRRIVRMPDVSHVMFQVEYGRDHPDIEAARKFSKRAGYTLEQLQAQKRIEDEFERQAVQQVQEFDLEIPLEQDIEEANISWEEDESGHVMPCPSRIKASMKIPRRTEHYPPQRFGDVDDLERFFDLQNYPANAASCPRAPPGREQLNPDLWELEDPWWFQKQTPDGPPLIQFD